MTPEQAEKLTDILYDIELTDFGGEYYGCENYDTRTDPSGDDNVESVIKSDFARCDMDSSYHFNQTQTDWVNAQYEEMLKAFESDHNAPSDYGKMTDAQRELLNDYENEWFDPCLVEVRFYEYEEGKIRASVNIEYTDAPYYRGMGSESLGHVDMTLAALLKADNAAEIVTLALKKQIAENEKKDLN